MLMQRLRDGSSGILAKIIVGLIIVVFALFGFGSITTFLVPVPKAATVNGSEITQQTMEIAVERQRRRLLAQDVPAEDIDEDELRGEVLDSLVSREVLTQAAEGMGLYISAEAIDDQIRRTQAFQIDGVFDPEQFKLTLGGAGYSPLTYRDELKADILIDQMRSGIRQSAFMTPGEIRRYGALVLQMRDISWLRIDVDAIKSEVSISDEAISDYYNQHTAGFVTEEAVSLEYVELRLEDLAAKVAVTPEVIQQQYEETKDSYTKKESRRVSHILSQISDTVHAADARARIDGILEQLRNVEAGDAASDDRKTFAELAREHSDDPGSAANGGDLGFNEPGIFAPEFEAVANELELNQLSDPVLTQYGYHIIKVTEIEPAYTPPLDEIRDDVESTYRTSVARDEFVMLSTRLSELLFENFDLEVPASETGLTRQTTGMVTRSTDTGLMANAEVAVMAFSPDVLVDRNNSDVIEISDDYHVALRVLEHKPGALRTIEEVTAEIRAMLQQEQAIQLAESRAADMIKAMDAGSLARYVADQYGLSWETLAGATRTTPDVDVDILDGAFNLPRPVEGRESVGITRLPDGDSAVLRVSSVTDRQPVTLRHRSWSTCPTPLPPSPER